MGRPPYRIIRPAKTPLDLPTDRRRMKSPAWQGDMAQPRLFTLEEANALVPTLHRLVGRQMLRQAEIEDRLRQLKRVAGPDLHDLEIAEDDGVEVRQLKTDL